MDRRSSPPESVTVPEPDLVMGVALVRRLVPVMAPADESGRPRGVREGAEIEGAAGDHQGGGVGDDVVGAVGHGAVGDGGGAGVGVRAGEGEQAGARLGQADGAGSIVRNDRIEGDAIDRVVSNDDIARGVVRAAGGEYARVGGGAEGQGAVLVSERMPPDAPRRNVLAAASMVAALVPSVMLWNRVLMVVTVEPRVMSEGCRCPR